MLKGTGVYSIAVFAGRLSGLLLLPVYTRYLTPADYGAFELLELTLSVFALLVGMRFSEALLYYYAAAPDTAEKHRVVSTLYLGALGLAAAGGLLGFGLAPQLSRWVFGSSDYVSYFHLMFASFALSLPHEAVLSYIRANDRPAAYVRASLCQLGLATTFNLTFLIAFGWGLEGLLWSKVAVAVLMAVGMAVYTLRRVRLSFNRRLCLRMFRYAAPLGASGLGFLIIHYGDRFFLQRYVPLAEIGVYALAYKLGMMISYVQTPFDVYWSAQLFNLVKGPQGQKVFVRVCTYEMLGLAPVVMLLALFSEGLIRVVAGPNFSAAAQYVPWIAGAYLVRTIGSHFRGVFLLERKTEWEAGIVWLGAFVCLIAYGALIPSFTLWGAVGATGLAFGVMAMAGFWKAQRVRRYCYEYRRLAIIALAAGIPIGLFSQVQPAEFWLRQSFAAGLACLYPALLWILGFIDEDEKAVLRFWSRRSWVLNASSGQ